MKISCVCYGEVSEWLIEPVSKTGVPFAGTAGSNPALSVILDRDTASSQTSESVVSEVLPVWRW